MVLIFSRSKEAIAPSRLAALLHMSFCDSAFFGQNFEGKNLLEYKKIFPTHNQRNKKTLSVRNYLRYE